MKIITEKEKQQYGITAQKKHGYGSVKQWRTVMMIEANLGIHYKGKCYEDLSDFINEHFDEAKLRAHIALYPVMGGDWYD